MTWALAFAIVGAVWLKSAIENRPVRDVLRGVFTDYGPGPGAAGFAPNEDLLAGVLTGSQSSGSAAPANGSTQHRTGVGTFDGEKVAAWIIPLLQQSRAAGWAGTVTSGYRTPEYSESLCFDRCGQPSCPGTCAGRSSNHSGTAYPHGAVDVTDYTNFGTIQRRIGSPLRNSLPSDRVHFSVSGT